MFKRLALTVAAFTLVAGLSGCSKPNAKKDDLVKALKQEQVSDSVANCVADALFDDKYPNDQKTLNEIAAAESKSDLPTDVQKTVDAVIADCKSAS
jgi:hypothetical protein